MKILAMAIAALLAAGSGMALAQDRDGRRDGTRDGYRGDRTDRGDGHRGGHDGHRGGHDGRRHWDGRHSDGRHWDGRRHHHHHGHYYGPRHHHHHGHYYGPRHHHHHGHYYGPRSYGYYAYPRSYGYFYEPPLYSYVPGYFHSYPEPPIVVERVYEEPLPHYERREYEERSYAQVTPREPAPRPPAPMPAQPAPRLERYTLSATELFEFDQATLRQPQPKLDEIADVMRREAGIRNVTITGHTDRLGSDSYNLKLSQRRAEAVKSYLVGKGVEASRLNAVGKGKANPVVQCNDKDRAALIRCLEPNRRVEVEQISVTRRVP